MEMTQETEGMKLWLLAEAAYEAAWRHDGPQGEQAAAYIIDKALTERDATIAEQAKQIEALREAHWFYLGDDCSSDQCRFDINECISEDFEWDNEPKGQHVLQISGARPVPDMWVALHYYTDEEKDERGDDESYTYSVHDSEAEAHAALAGVSHD